ncbi:WbqC family protein [Flavobacteriaceae bacterium]|nr:WbqC family protein [Flavobacteriaceae bacterium]
MILTAHQPVYLPWLGLFHKIYLSDQFCYFDIVQYQIKDYNNRNLIKFNSTSNWLTVPVESKNHFQKKICDIKIVPGNWNKKHYKSISLNYKKSRFYDLYIDDIEKILLKTKYEFLSDLNFDILIFLKKSLGLKTEIVKASDFNFQGEKSDLVLDMCKKLKASKYIFGSQGKDYADKKSFEKENIEIFFQEYKHPIYEQINGEFISNLSMIDLLFNKGPESLEILLSNNLKKIS